VHLGEEPEKKLVFVEEAERNVLKEGSVDVADDVRNAFLDGLGSFSIPQAVLELFDDVLERPDVVLIQERDLADGRVQVDPALGDDAVLFADSLDVILSLLSSDEPFLNLDLQLLRKGEDFYD